MMESEKNSHVFSIMMYVRKSCEEGNWELATTHFAGSAALARSIEDRFSQNKKFIGNPNGNRPKMDRSEDRMVSFLEFQDIHMDMEWS